MEGFDAAQDDAVAAGGLTRPLMPAVRVETRRAFAGAWLDIVQHEEWQRQRAAVFLAAANANEASPQALSVPAARNAYVPREGDRTLADLIRAFRKDRHTFGRCFGGATRHLPPQIGRQVRYPVGPFMSVLAPTLATKLEGETPANLFLGLLVKAPDADGVHHQEMVSADYERLEVSLVELNGRHLSNTNALTFEVPPEAPPASHLGLFDEAGQLRFYGRLLSTREASTPARLFELRPYSLSVIRLNPEHARRRWHDVATARVWPLLNGRIRGRPHTVAVLANCDSQVGGSKSGLDAGSMRGPPQRSKPSSSPGNERRGSVAATENMAPASRQAEPVGIVRARI